MKISQNVHLLASGALGTGMTHPYDCNHSEGSRNLHDTLNLQVGASTASAKALEAGDKRAISLDKAKEFGVYPTDFEFAACPVDRKFEDGEVFRLGNCEVEVIATPGHSHDMVSYLFRTEEGPFSSSGDTLFFGGRILLSNVYDCDVQQYVNSLRKLAGHSFDALFPGHGLWVVREAASHLKQATDALDRLLLPCGSRRRKTCFC